MGWTYTVNELARIAGAEAPAGDATFGAVSTDTRTLQSGEVFFALSGENFDGNRFVGDAFAKGAVAAVTTQSVAGGPCVVVDDPLRALQVFAAAHRARFDIPVIAITGSCGKTSTKDMIAAVLASNYRVAKTEGNLNNAIGLPLSLLAIDDATEAAVLEMGANHRGEIAELCEIAKPNETAITMIAEAHLEGFGSVEDVAAAKAEIMEGLPDDGLFYVNADDPRCRRIGERFEGRKVYFGSAGDVALRSCRFDRTGEMSLDIDPVGTLTLPLHARAHAMNVALAVAAGLQHGICDFEAPLRDACCQAARFKVSEVGPLLVLDDSYNANPASVAAALEALADRPVDGARIAALGDMLELGAESASLHRGMGEKAAELEIDRLYVRGDFAPAVAEGARAGGLSSVHVIDDHRAMAEAIAAEAGPGDALLVKGSRGMRMETVIEYLMAHYAGAAEAQAANGNG